MTIRKIRKWWWVDFRWKRRRYRYKSPANSAEAAKDYEQLLRGKLARGEPLVEPPSQRPLLFSDFVDEWFRVYVVANNKPSEQVSKRNRLRLHLLPAFGHLALSEIAEHQIERFKADKHALGLSPKYINNLLTALRKCLDTAREWGYLQTVPRVKWLTVPPQRFDFLTPEESDQLLRAAIATPFWYVLCLCALRTGMRFGELAGLQWGDVDLDRGVITVARSVVSGVVSAPKNNRARTLPVSPDLAMHFALARPTHGWLFPGRDGSPLKYDAARAALQRIVRRAGLRPITWHTLRHSFASQLVLREQNLFTVQECLGHSTLQMTRRYSHLNAAKLKSAVAVLATVEAQRLAARVGTGWSRVPAQGTVSAPAHEPPNPISSLNPAHTLAPDT